MMLRIGLSLLVAGGALLWTASVSAHIQLEAPVARTTQQKTGPCGADGGVRGDQVTVFEPGQTITVSWTETIDHPGHFRISFDDDGVDDFADPTAFDDFYTNDAVLLDDIADTPSGGPSSVETTLPDVECESCTLQLIQVMTDKPPFGPEGGNDFYYQCADLALRRTTVPADDPAVADVGSDTAAPDTLDMTSDTTAPGDTSSPMDTAEHTDTALPSDTAVPTDTGAPTDTQVADTLGMEVEVEVRDDPESDCACASVRTTFTDGPGRSALWLGVFALVGLGARRLRRPKQGTTG